ncbi:MAG: putative toxin-antitoxin system toxin component, PIN family [Betaproteobacteria bacterium]|nr:putative toxin-antitoxin system toxin component, PIN family [Betaproteobacteria bacterium]MBK7278050.1 putative toxin-antitoxin system toxin component, PIN family [Betaproteobacteria bacterium]MBK9684191.1 putative toxin-antitoxin system toxin component, PIN family [Betaproteobacteria bacterium]MBL0297067.1 putative toxin-antitoxin system toxin component, PIN family [Betaproteobacteria bacterium]MBP6317014.1 putative toxin-antitoxin system toxin component, PIN family [Rubrivivax sp.]
MSRQAVVVDTNVVVAGLLTGNAASPVARILDGMLAATFPFVVSEALLAEYRTVLVRPALRKLHGLTVAEVEALLTDIAQDAIVPVPMAVPVAPAAQPAPDPGDQGLRDLLAARADLLLATGDKALLADRGMQPRVVTPLSFVEAG